LGFRSRRAEFFSFAPPPQIPRRHFIIHLCIPSVGPSNGVVRRAFGTVSHSLVVLFLSCVFPLSKLLSIVLVFSVTDIVA
jgi:hypothetical protein